VRVLKLLSKLSETTDGGCNTAKNFFETSEQAWSFQDKRDERREKNRERKKLCLSAHIRRNNLSKTTQGNYNDFLNYRFSGIEFHGRKENMDIIHDFMSSKSTTLSLLPIIGQNGVGKSKLAFHTVRFYSERKYYSTIFLHKNFIVQFIMKIIMKKWKALWINNRNINVIQKLKIDKVPKRLLIICDYANHYTNKISDFIEKLAKESNKSYIRIIVLATSSGQWYSDLIGKIESTSQMDLKLHEAIKLEINENTLTKDDCHLILRDLMTSKYRQLINETVAKEVNPITRLFSHLNPNNEKINKIETREHEKLGLNDNIDKAIYNKVITENKSFCLLLLYGDYALEEKNKKINCGEEFDDSSLKFDDKLIMKDFIDRNMKRWERDIREYISRTAIIYLITLASVIGPFSLCEDYTGDCRKQYLDQVKEKHGTDSRKLEALFSNVSTGNMNRFESRVPSFTPDSIAEYYVVYFYDQLNYQTKKDWLNLLLDSNYAQSSAEFVKRLYLHWNHIDIANKFANDCVMHICNNHDDYSETAGAFVSILCRVAININNYDAYDYFTPKLEDIYKAYSEQTKPYLIELYESQMKYYKSLDDTVDVSEIQKKLNNLQRESLTAKKGGTKS
jgi:hypothetical protein